MKPTQSKPTIRTDHSCTVLILARLYRYRRAFSSILASNDTTKSRFMRLYVLCITWILCFVPLQAVIFNRNLGLVRYPYSWSETHNKQSWDQIVMVPTSGAVVYDRWIWLVCAFLLFVFFGLGGEALTMYRTSLLSVGLGHIFPGLRTQRNRSGSATGTFSSFGSRAKIFFRPSSWRYSSRSDSITSDATTTSGALSSKNVTFLDTINEGQEKASSAQTVPNSHNVAKANSATQPTSSISRLTSFLKGRKPSAQDGREQLPLANMSGQPATVRSNVSAGQLSPTLSGYTESSKYCEVMVKKEVRQGSEAAETLPTATYNAV